jgi:hypothetical protein
MSHFRSLSIPVALAIALMGFNSAFAQTGSGSDTTVLGATPSTINQGQSVALTAEVEPSVSGPTPTGSVQFFYGSYLLGTSTLSNGAATFVASSAGQVPGSYAVTASYSGDANYSASTSSPTSITITHYTTATTLSLPGSVKEGANVQFTASVSDTSGSKQPTGSVSLELGSTVLETASLVNGVATFNANTSGYASGSYSLTAVYSGDTYNAPSTSSPQSVTVLGTTATAVSFGSNGYAVGQTGMISATVTAPSGGGTPSGTVSFAVGPNVFASAPLVNGVASVTASTATLPTGNYDIVATYSGSSLFQPSSGSANVSLGAAYTLSPAGVALSPSGTTQFSISPAVAGTVTWYVNGVAGGNSSVGTIDSNGNYTAPATTSAVTATITATDSAEPTYSASAATAYVIPAGTVSTTQNGYVADYSISLPSGASVAVNFGQTTSYGLNTWSVAAPSGGGSTTVEVAGMIASTQYHLQGVVSLPGGVTFTDADNTFTPVGLSANNFPNLQIATNTTPQPGVEMMDSITGYTASLYSVDLDGNIIWAWQPPDAANGSIVQPVKVLPNGHLLILIGQSSTQPLAGGVPEGAYQGLDEIDLAGNIIRNVTLATINANLVTAGYPNIQLLTIHHEVLVLPNGHWVFLGNMLEEETVTGYVNQVNVLGDVIVDIDPNNNYAVDWVWNEFDHLNVNRHPYQFPDWTHSNGLAYSTDDGNLVLSIRHQNWVLKINYADGQGDGTILWHLGAADPAVNETADFTLLNADGTTDTNDQDWQYAQHNPNFTTANTTGVFGLTLMDNGDDRGVYDNAQCGSPNPACYSTVPIFTVDENAMTVTRTLPDELPVSYYSFFGGSANPQPNGDLEYDLASHVTEQNATGSAIRETTTGSSPSVVWEFDESGEYLYRAFRIGSLYPGVTWTPGAGISAEARKAHRVAPGTVLPARAPMGPSPTM